MSEGLNRLLRVDVGFICHLLSFISMRRFVTVKNKDFCLAGLLSFMCGCTTSGEGNSSGHILPSILLAEGMK